MAHRILCTLLLGLTALLGAPCRPHAARSQDRVATASARKRTELEKLFRERGLAYPPREVFLRVFKRERVLELWARAGAERFQLLRSYPICAASGELGPKRRAGDSQVPEGFYAIERFNPRSAFHLSLGIDYPNASDRNLGRRGNLGGDIFIHGGCASIGCVAIGDDSIDEVYLVATAARTRGQRRIPVHIFPTRLDATGRKWLREQFAERPGLLRFWAGLQAGFAPRSARPRP